MGHHFAHVMFRAEEKSGGLFTCGEDNADPDADFDENPTELEETKEREQPDGG